MRINDVPFNIDLLLLKSADVKNIKPIKALDIFDGLSKNFHSEGLFSTEIFGKAGEERRNRMFSYINLHTDILHPIIYKAYIELWSLHEEIISGKTYAIFNKDTNSFEKSDPINGSTGYGFFLQHYTDIDFEERPSPKREFNIKLIKKYQHGNTFNKLVVLPAGLRDYEIDENGKPSSDEINTIYRNIMSVAGMIETVSGAGNSEYLDKARYNLQLKVNELFAYIKNILEGKHGFVLGKWSSRKIYNSTRNVLTSYVHSSDNLNSPTNVNTNQTVVGLYQYMRATLPLSIKNVRDTYLRDIFIGPNSPCMLVNRQTLKRNMVTIDPDYYDSWMTNEGLESLFSKYSQENIRHDVITIADNYYLALIYKGPDKTFKVFSDITTLPSNRSKDDVYPITLTELLYLSSIRDSHTIPCLVTRYPITGYGSIYPSYCYVKSTVSSEVRYELDDNWMITDVIAREFPIRNQPFTNSISVNNSHLSRLGADFDGDTVSFTCAITEDAKQEIANTLNSAKYYVGVNGKMSFSVDNDIVSLVLASMTG
jgi:hypothetical protein